MLKQKGFIRGDIVVLLVTGLALVGLLAHYALKGQDVPILQALLVAAVNLVAAGNLLLRTIKAKKAAEQQRLEASKPAQDKDSDAASGN